MKKIGIYFDSSISDSFCQFFLEKQVELVDVEVFSNIEREGVQLIKEDSLTPIDIHEVCRERIGSLNKEFYSRFNDTPLYNSKFNFWNHLRFNSHLQLLTYYRVKAWINNVKNIQESTGLKFIGLNQKTKNLVQFEYPEATFESVSKNNSFSSNKTKLSFNLFKMMFYGGITVFSIFKKRKSNLLISIEGSYNQINSSKGLIVEDKFMFYLKEKINESDCHKLLNSNLFSKIGLDKYEISNNKKNSDFSGESVLFHSLFKVRFWKEILKARKFINGLKISEDSLLDIIIQNNKGGAITELLTYWSYYFFFKKRKYKNIVLISEMSPGTNSIVRVAKQFGINVIGIQHGLLNENNFAYNYSNEELLIDNPFPNHLIVWGKEELDFLSKNKDVLKDTVKAKGNVVLDGLKYLPKKENTNEFVVIFASQPQPIHSLRMKSLDDFVGAVLKFKPEEIKVVMRLHPRETENYELYKPSLSKLEKYDVEIDKGSELFSQLNKSDVLVTCYSTVSKDALLLKMPIVLQDYDENDYTGLLSRNVAHNATDPSSLYEILLDIKEGRKNIDPANYTNALSELYAATDFNVAEKIIPLLIK